MGDIIVVVVVSIFFKINNELKKTMKIYKSTLKINWMFI